MQNNNICKAVPFFVKEFVHVPEQKVYKNICIPNAVKEPNQYPNLKLDIKKKTWYTV